MTPDRPDPSRAPAIIRELRWSDLDALTDTYYALYDERERGDPIGITLFEEKPTAADQVSWFSNLYRRGLTGDAITSIAELDHRAVGNCTVGRIAARADAENGHVGDLGILVRREYRGRGVGRALLRDALARCHSVFEIVRLSVFANNVRAKKLYTEFGFREIGRLPRAIRRGDGYIDEDLMVLNLGAGTTRPPSG
ncbi:MAG TPA: GNAT family N-acetyltransferase [Thermoplasmata archaeon]|nr:GNAT family N-acetyltransferase [Thermoplasmata archaeon]